MKNRMVPLWWLAMVVLTQSAQPRTIESLPTERAQDAALKAPRGFVLGIVADAVSGKPIESATVTLNVLAPGGDPNAPAGTVASSRSFSIWGSRVVDERGRTIAARAIDSASTLRRASVRAMAPRQTGSEGGTHR
jgi:hypothetical protein